MQATNETRNAGQPENQERLDPAVLPPLPVRTQLNIFDRILGALIAAISQPILFSLKVTFRTLFLYSIVLGAVGAFFSLDYQVWRKTHNPLASFFLALGHSLNVLLSLLLCITFGLTLVIIGSALSLPFMPFIWLYQGFNQGVLGVVKNIIQQQLSEFQVFVNLFILFSKAYRLVRLILDENEQPTAIIEILEDLNRLLEPIPIPRMDKLKLKAIQNFLSLSIEYDRIDRNNASPFLDVQQELDRAISVCVNIQEEIFNQHKNLNNPTPSLSDELEVLVLRQQHYLTQLKQCLASEPPDWVLLQEFSQQALAQPQELEQRFSVRAKEIWRTVYASVFRAERQQQDPRDIVIGFADPNIVWRFGAAVANDVLNPGSRNMTEAYFEENFVLSPQEQNLIAHIRLTEHDRCVCREKAQLDQYVRKLFDQYEEIERNFKEECLLLCDVPERANKIILVKQYCVNNQTSENNPEDQWLPIPNHKANVVFDRQSFKTLCCQQNPLVRSLRHPFDNSDALLSPTPYETAAHNANGQTQRYRTRYRYHAYYQNPGEVSDENKIYSQTLQSIAVELYRHVPTMRDFARSQQLGAIGRRQQGGMISAAVDSGTTMFSSPTTEEKVALNNNPNDPIRYAL